MDYSFETRALSVGYDGKALIKDISVGVNRGEIVALIGPNGSGKSTILKSVARQLAPIAGTVMLNREDMRRAARRDVSRKMAVMLTDRTRTELLTCRDIVSMGRYPYTGRLGLLTGEDRAKVVRALATVGALSIAEKDFNLLSDGQRQRVLLARALCQEPEILLLDEPTSFLDIHFKLELLAILRSMARETGLTVLLSLHEIDLAQKLADRVLCVKGDTVARFGAPGEVFTEDFVRELYGLDGGFYDPLFGSVELAKTPGAPKVFVLSNCGNGISVYRALQREGVPFAAGILYENDVDYRLAHLLAARVVTEKAFEPISDAALDAARALMRDCERVLDAGVVIGPSNARMEALICEAKSVGKYEAARDYLNRR